MILYRKYRRRFVPFAIHLFDHSVNEYRLLLFSELRTGIALMDCLDEYRKSLRHWKTYHALLNELAKIFKEVFGKEIGPHLSRSNEYEYHLDWYRGKITKELMERGK